LVIDSTVAQSFIVTVTHGTPVAGVLFNRYTALLELIG
jgi:hypothetical protein